MFKQLTLKIKQAICSHEPAFRKTKLDSEVPSFIYGNYVVTYCDKCGKELFRRPTSDFNGAAVSSKKSRSESIQQTNYADDNFGYDLEEKANMNQSTESRIQDHNTWYSSELVSKCPNNSVSHHHHDASSYSSSDSSGGSSSSCGGGGD